MKDDNKCRVHPHDWIEKGRKYDTLKKRNDELVEALGELMKDIDNGYGKFMSSTYNNAKQALKNNEND